jgi:deoxyribonuclease-4
MNIYKNKIIFDILMKMQYIGAHINKESGSLIKTMNVIKKQNGNALQLFVSNPRSASLPNMQTYQEASKEIQEYCIQHDFKLVIHASYTINLAKEPKEGKKTMEWSDCYWIKLLLHELIAADMIGAMAVVVHVGKYTSSKPDAALMNMFKAISYIVDNMHELKLKCKLLIETPAGAGTELLTDIRDFLQFYNTFDASQKKYMGICLDTAHIWSTGYDINEYYKIVKESNAKDVLVIHFNNSKREKGSHVDAHETLFNGDIPQDSLQHFADSLSHQPIIILEKPSSDMKKEFQFIEESCASATRSK